jgi:hypothetical protein
MLKRGDIPEGIMCIFHKHSIRIMNVIVIGEEKYLEVNNQIIDPFIYN